MNQLKTKVKKYWENEVCGTRYSSIDDRKRFFSEIESARYQLDHYIQEFANFKDYRGKKVLEIGVGAGIDFSHWLKNGAEATGIDLTKSAIRMTREYLNILGINRQKYKLLVADAETLPFKDIVFDLVYAYGVFHHTPNTEQAIKEAFRVLKPGGALKAMVYHIPSWTGWMFWARHCLLKGRPFNTSRQAIFNYLESPGTKTYKISEMKKLLNRIGFCNIVLTPKLGAGDLLNIKPSKKYQSTFDKLLWKIYPRWLVKICGNRYGLGLFIEAKKPNVL